MADDEMPEWAKQMEARLTTRLIRQGELIVRGFDRVQKTVDAIRRDIADINGRLDGIDADLARIFSRLDRDENNR